MKFDKYVSKFILDYLKLCNDCNTYNTIDINNTCCSCKIYYCNKCYRKHLSYCGDQYETISIYCHNCMNKFFNYNFK